MSEKEKKGESQSLGPSVVLGLVGAVVVLLLLGAGIWGVSKVISNIRDSDEESEEEVAEESSDEQKDEEGTEGESEGEGEEGETDSGDQEDGDAEDGDIDGDGASDEPDSEEDSEEGDSEDEEDGEESDGEVAGEMVTAGGPWVATDYKSGDITGDSHTVVWGDTLWEISEARYGSGFEWKKILNANLDIVGYLPDGSRALIIPGQVLALPD